MSDGLESWNAAFAGHVGKVTPSQSLPTRGPLTEPSGERASRLNPVLNVNTTMNINSLSSFRRSTDLNYPLEADPVPRILVMDSDRDIRDMNRDLLNHSGYWVDTASNVLDAWTQLSSDRTVSYNLLLAEHDFPGINSLELVKQLRTFNHAMPVILVLGMIPSYAPRLDSRLNIQSVIYKPYDFENLRVVVKKALWEEGSATSSEYNKRPLHIL